MTYEHDSPTSPRASATSRPLLVASHAEKEREESEVFSQEQPIGYQPLINDKEAAIFLGMSVTTLRKWRVEGRGPRFYRLGRSVRYAIPDLESFRESNQVLPWEDPRKH